VKLAVRRPYWDVDGLPAAMVSDQPFERLDVTGTENGSGSRLTCWINGQQASKLDDWNPDRIGRFVMHEIAAARPAAAGNLELLEVTAWGQNAYALGSDHAWGPGQLTRFGDVAYEPWGPVHWIGEHVAIREQGVEGAMESAEREVARLLLRMGANSG
jgi:monoamine oxidase